MLTIPIAMVGYFIIAAIVAGVMSRIMPDGPNAHLSKGPATVRVATSVLWPFFFVILIVWAVAWPFNKIGEAIARKWCEK